MKRIALLLPALMLACSCPLATVDFGEEAPAQPPTALSAPTVPPAPTVVPEPAVFPSDAAAIARGHLQALTDIGPRWAGTPEDVQTQQYIVNAFSAAGYSAEIQPLTAFDEWEEEYVDTANVVAIKPGQSPRQIIVGAHYDSSDEGRGSDDNASGVSVLLAAAELIRDADPPYTIVFVAFGAEEAGFLGSTAFVGEMDADEIANTLLFVNMDSLAAGNVTYVYGDNDDGDAARDWLLEWAGDNGYPLETIEDANLSQDGEATADYGPFQDAGIPWIYFEATDWNLGDEDGYTQVDPRYGKDGAIIHTEYDHLTYLDETFPGRVDAHLDLYVAVLYQLLTGYH
jgi:hypothetical protein